MGKYLAYSMRVQFVFTNQVSYTGKTAMAFSSTINRRGGTAYFFRRSFDRAHRPSGHYLFGWKSEFSRLSGIRFRMRSRPNGRQKEIDVNAGNFSVRFTHIVWMYSSLWASVAGGSRPQGEAPWTTTVRTSSCIAYNYILSECIS